MKKFRNMGNKLCGGIGATISSREALAIIGGPRESITKEEHDLVEDIVDEYYQRWDFNSEEWYYMYEFGSVKCHMDTFSDSDSD